MGHAMPSRYSVPEVAALPTARSEEPDSNHIFAQVPLILGGGGVNSLASFLPYPARAMPPPSKILERTSEPELRSSEIRTTPSTTI